MAIDTERFKPRRPPRGHSQFWGVTHDHILFGLIGRLDKQKGSARICRGRSGSPRAKSEGALCSCRCNTLCEGDFDRFVLDRIHELKLAGKVILTDFPQRYSRRDERTGCVCDARHMKRTRQCFARRRLRVGSRASAPTQANPRNS